MTQIPNSKPSVFGHSNFEFRYYLGFRILILGFLLVPGVTHAGLIFKAPSSIGLISGLVGYWSFDESTHGTTSVADLSGNNNRGYMINGPRKAAGKIGQGLSFDGVDDLVQAPPASSINNLGPMSTSFWIFPKSSKSGLSPRRVVGKDASSGASSWAIQTGGNSSQGLACGVNVTNNVAFFKSNSAATADYANKCGAEGSLSLNEWQHFIVTWDGSAGDSGVHMYRNGLEVSYTSVATQGGSAGSDTSLNFLIGNSPSANIATDGLIDEVRIYNRALNENEIRRLYRMGATLKLGKSEALNTGSLTQGLVGYWSFDESTHGTTSVADLSGNNNRGFMINGPRKAIGKIGQALEFDGVNDYVDLGASFDNSNPASLCVWAKWERFLSGDTIFFSNEESGFSGETLGLHVHDNGGVSVTIVYNSPNSENYNAPAGTLTLNNWYHICGVKYGYTAGVDDGAVYVNGIKRSGSASLNVAYDPTLGENMTLGRAGAGDADYQKATFDDARIYNRALNENEIRRLYRMGATLKLGSSQALNTGSLTQGLVGYWSFDESTHGTTSVADLSGNNNRGYMINGPRKAIGKIGQALSFDGGNDYVRATVSGGGTTNTATLTAWVRVKTLGASKAVLEDGTNRKGLTLSDAAGSPITYFWENTADEYAAATGLMLTPGTWHFVAVVITPTAATVYRDNSSFTNTKTHNAKNLNVVWDIGSDNETAVRFYAGDIDEVRIYSRALNENEIRRLYLMGR